MTNANESIQNAPAPHSSTDQVAHENSTVVGNISDFAEGVMKVVHVGHRRVLLVRTAKGLYALDNACPHQGYGLARGDLAGDTVTCIWHNWKFAVDTGECVVGEENVRTHSVLIHEDGTVRVTLAAEDRQAAIPRLRESVDSGLRKGYLGQVARDVVRLLQANDNPGELVWRAIEWGAPRAEYGWGHSVALATDCITLLDRYEGVDRALPIVQAFSGIVAENRPEMPSVLPEPTVMTADARLRFRSAIEREAVEEAQSLLRGALLSGVEPAIIREWLTSVASDHFLNYGHGAIYTQKAFELLDHLGWDRADTVLGHLVPAIGYGTREDRLPYMRPFMKAMQEHSLETIMQTIDREDPASWDSSSLSEALLNGGKRADVFGESFAALQSGSGVDRLLDVAVATVSERMMRFVATDDFDLSDDFGWLDLTHGITFANAARWQWEHHRGPDALRQALFAVWLSHWTGRHEWHTKIGERDTVQLDASIATASRVLTHESLLDRSGSFIVTAHGVKTAVAAEREALRTGSPVVLEATARFLRTPKMERFVAANVQQSVDFLTGRTQRE
jgi:nitrite reductase/ring-hydroxylating ferredoxin subunit